jgi:hypothetical protein
VSLTPPVVTRLLEQGLNEPEALWARAADELPWFRRWDRVFEWTPPTFRWFIGAETNLAFNALDHHVRTGRAGHAALVATYGREILREDETIDRVKLANIAFATPEAAKKLNALIHPIVVQQTNELLDEYERTHGDGIVIVEATLMIESGGRERYDRLVPRCGGESPTSSRGRSG